MKASKKLFKWICGFILIALVCSPAPASSDNGNITYIRGADQWNTWFDRGQIVGKFPFNNQYRVEISDIPGIIFYYGDLIEEGRPQSKEILMAPYGSIASGGTLTFNGSFLTLGEVPYYSNPEAAASIEASTILLQPWGNTFTLTNGQMTASKEVIVSDGRANLFLDKSALILDAGSSDASGSLNGNIIIGSGSTGSSTTDSALKVVNGRWQSSRNIVVEGHGLLQIEGPGNPSLQTSGGVTVDGGCVNVNKGILRTNFFQGIYNGQINIGSASGYGTFTANDVDMSSGEININNGAFTAINSFSGGSSLEVNVGSQTGRGLFIANEATLNGGAINFFSPQARSASSSLGAIKFKSDLVDGSITVGSNSMATLGTTDISWLNQIARSRVNSINWGQNVTAALGIAAPQILGSNGNISVNGANARQNGRPSSAEFGSGSLLVVSARKFTDHDVVLAGTGQSALTVAPDARLRIVYGSEGKEIRITSGFTNKTRNIGTGWSGEYLTTNISQLKAERIDVDPSSGTYNVLLTKNTESNPGSSPEGDDILDKFPGNENGGNSNNGSSSSGSITTNPGNSSGSNNGSGGNNGSNNNSGGSTTNPDHNNGNNNGSGNNTDNGANDDEVTDKPNGENPDNEGQQEDNSSNSSDGSDNQGNTSTTSKPGNNAGNQENGADINFGDEQANEIVDSVESSGNYIYDVDSSYGGVKFISRLITDEYIGRSDPGLIGPTLESAARMVVIGAVPQMAIAINKATSEAMTRRSSLKETAGPMAIMDITGDVTDDRQKRGATLWITPLYQSSNGFGLTGDYLNLDYHGGIGGAVIGGDYTFDSIRAGLAFSIGGGYAQGSGDYSKTTNNLNFWGVGAYASWTVANFGLSGDINYNSIYNILKQDLPAAMQMDDLKADVRSWTLSAGLRAEFKFSTDFADIIPHAGVRYLSLNVEDYDIESSGQTIIEGNSFYKGIWTFPVGIAFDKKIELDHNWHFKPSLDFAIIPVAGDVNIKNEIRFTGVDANPNFKTQIIDNVTYMGQAGLAFGNDAINFGLNYNIQAGMKTTAHSIAATFSYEF